MVNMKTPADDKKAKQSWLFIIGWILISANHKVLARFLRQHGGLCVLKGYQSAYSIHTNIFSDEALVASVFSETLDVIYVFSKPFVVWQKLDDIHTDMKGLKPLQKYPSLRAVVHVVEVSAEQPSQRSQQLLMHSKSGFSVKILVAISPSNGQVMLVSPVFCGRAPDTQVLAMSGLPLAKDETFVKSHAYPGVYMVFGPVGSPITYDQAFEDPQIRSPTTAALNSFLSLESIRNVSSTLVQFEKMSVVASLITNLKNRP